MRHFSECVDIVLDGSDDSYYILNIRYCVHLILSTILGGIYCYFPTGKVMEMLSHFPRVSLLDIGRTGMHTISLIAEAELARAGSHGSGEDSADLDFRIMAFEPWVYYWLLSWVSSTFPWASVYPLSHPADYMTSYTQAHPVNFKL